MMKKSRPLLLLTLLILCHSTAFASAKKPTSNIQTISPGIELLHLTPESVSASIKPAKQNELYILSPGDSIEISLYGKPDSVRQAIVDQRGYISYPSAGSIKAEGKTIPELAKDLSQSLGQMLRTPLVSVIPLDFKSRRYTIAGAVIAPGSYFLSGQVRVLDAIGLAKGFKTSTAPDFTGMSAADLDHAVLLRNQKYIPVNFHALIEHGQAKENIQLTPGDYIFIPEIKARSITVLGEVGAPGVFEYNEPITLIQALVKAKGFTAKSDQGMVMVLRGSLSAPTVFKVDPGKIVQGKDPDLILQDNDFVYVPKRSTYDLEQLLRLAVNTFVQALSTAEVTKVFNILPTATGN